NQDALQAVLREIAHAFRDATAGAAAAPRTPVHETNLVRVEPFFGTEEEDPLEWVELFDRAADANNWTPGRKTKIASGYLRGVAAN
ncbi:32006_t:CDS:1, partial [Racocetra persica]